MPLQITGRVGNLTQREPVVAAPDETLRGVAHKMWSNSVGLVVIGDERRPVGVISERDIISELAQGSDVDVKTAREAMTHYVISVRPEDPVFEAAGHMLHDGIRHLPVIDKDRRVLGMVSIRDLLRPLLLDALGTRDPDGGP